MITLDPRRAARDAIASNATRPATAILFDAPDARLLVFRIAPGQAVAPHSNASTVMLHVLEGEGVVSGANGDGACKPGDVIVYEPGEVHGMRAVDYELQLLAVITPRPGQRAAESPPQPLERR